MAEVASICNEALLIRYLLDHSKDNLYTYIKEHMFLLEYSMETKIILWKNSLTMPIHQRKKTVKLNKKTSPNYMLTLNRMAWVS